MKIPQMALLALCAGVACAGQEGAEFRFRAGITAPPGYSHYRVLLPADVYKGVLQRDLGDLRVLNALGEAVPYAFLPREAASPAPARKTSAKLFPLYGEESEGIDGVKLDVRRGAGGTVIHLAQSPRAAKSGRRLLGYLVEVPKAAQRFDALEFDWRSARGFNASVRVEAGDDLSRWRALVNEAPVLMLEHDGERLERKRVELHGATARYLRIAFTRVPADFALHGVQLEMQGERPEAEREWRRLDALDAALKPGEYRFDSGGRFPVDRARLHLPQQNTVARVQLLTRDSDDARWRTVASEFVYRLQRDGTTVSNPDLRLPPTGDRQWLVRADPRGGGLGAGAVGLEIGWRPHELVFAARGQPPFALAFGNERVRSESLAASAVIPGYKAEAEPRLQRATVGAVSASATASLSDPVAWVRARFASGEGRKWVLWIVLSLGVLAVAWMALRLLRDVGAGPPS